MKSKLGDKVRIITSKALMNSNQIGKITKVLEDNHFQVSFKGKVPGINPATYHHIHLINLTKEQNKKTLNKALGIKDEL